MIVIIVIMVGTEGIQTDESRSFVHHVCWSLHGPQDYIIYWPGLSKSILLDLSLRPRHPKRNGM